MPLFQEEIVIDTGKGEIDTGTKQKPDDLSHPLGVFAISLGRIDEKHAGNCEYYNANWLHPIGPLMGGLGEEFLVIFS